MGKKPEVVMVAREEKTAYAIKEQLEDILGPYMSFLPYSLRRWLSTEKKAHTVIVSTHILAHQAAQKAQRETDILILRRSLRKDAWKKILAIPQRQRILLVNDERDSTVETIALLYELGARHIELIPMYPGLTNIPPLTTAITPGESHLVPPVVKHIIDMGDRVVDLSTLVDLLTRFHLLNSETMNRMVQYGETIIPRSQGLKAAMEGLINLKDLFQESLNSVGDGVITYDENGRITVFNQSAATIFSCLASQAIGQDVDAFLASQGIKNPLPKGNIQEQLLQIHQQDLILSRHSITSHGETTGGVLTLQMGTRVKELEQKLRFQLKAKGHQSQYTFPDIIFTSPIMEKTVELARRMAHNDLNILIQGETGTGKELFAHSIHQASPRRRYPFVAINCSALPDNLLESELFGYEEGAFTGARKGGKPGLFEQAHRGTLFLDEIGDISPNLQARLLRVVQQKEILKIGGTQVLPVDVRILAASNKNLEDKTQEGTFRADLYHRLNILQLRIPSLKERREDIPLLASYFLKRRQYKGELSPAVLKVLEEYPWPGNVRELENTMDYLLVMGNKNIQPQDIPFYTSRTSTQDPPVPSTQEPSPPPIPWEFFPGDLSSLLLQLIYQAQRQSKSIGRRSLVPLVRKEGIIISEGGVHKLLKELQEKELLQMHRGRAGCRLTEKGYQFLARKEVSDYKV